MLPRFAATAVCALLVLSLAPGCKHKGSREWRADDHDQEPGGGAAPAGGAGDPAAAGDPNDQLATLVEATWTNNCATCHGRMGQGDGPQGPMVKAPDLTDPVLVDKLTDEAILATIRSGRGKMPAFPNIPEAVAHGLVMRIRALRAQ